MLVAHDLLVAFAAAARQAAAAGLMRCSSGNMSCRRPEGLMLVKASRSWMARLTPDDVSVCRIADGGLLAGRRPSVEMGFHSGVLRARADVNVVLHFQSSYATTLACRRELPGDYYSTPEVPYYIGPVANVPYLRPGSPELAEAVIAALKGHDLAMLASHGQVVVGTDYDDAIQKAVFFEQACEVLYRGGSEVRLLTAEEVRELKAGGKA